MRSALAIPILALTVPLFAQSSAKVDVRVINVDVSVVDASGKPVSGLKTGDFEVFEDNQLQKVTNFALLDPTAGRADGAHRWNDPQLRRRIVLLVDNNYIEKSDRDSALRKLDEFVDATFEGGYEWALGTLGQQLEIVQPFTTDRKAIHEATAKIRHSATSSFNEAMDRSILDDSLFQSKGLDISAQFESRERTARNARALARTARGLIDAAHVFAATEGKKMTVLLTGSMDLNTSFAAFSNSADRELQDSKNTVARIIDAIVREANDANMSINVIRAAAHQSAAPQHDVGYQSSGRGVEGVDLSSDSDIRDTSAGFTIASGTGGLFLTSNAVKDSSAAINAVAGSAYLLGYQPAHAEDRQYHHIAVHVKRPGTHVTYRQGYLDLPADERLEGLLRLRVSALQPASDVPVALNISELKSAGKPSVVMHATMPFAKVTLLPKDGRFVGRVHIYLSIFDAMGKNVGFHHQVRDLSFSAAERDKTAGNAFQYHANMRLDTGDFTVAVTMRDDLSNEIGTAVKRVKL